MILKDKNRIRYPYSIYKGVSWNVRSQKWTASIYLNYKTIHLGSFDNEIDAAQAYKDAFDKYFGDRMHLH